MCRVVQSSPNENWLRRRSADPVARIERSEIRECLPIRQSCPRVSLALNPGYARGPQNGDCAGVREVVKCALAIVESASGSARMAHDRCSQVVRLSAMLAMLAGLAAGAAAQDLKPWRH